VVQVQCGNIIVVWLIHRQQRCSCCLQINPPLRTEPTNMSAVSTAHTAADHTRWIAYDEEGKEAENMEIEPGNTRQRSMTWSDDDQMRPCTWRGCGMDTRSPSSIAAGSFAASMLPHRALTFEDTSAEPLRLQVSSAHRSSELSFCMRCMAVRHRCSALIVVVASLLWSRASARGGIRACILP
jgi:hypothetical protein